MSSVQVRLRPASRTDLAAINRLIEAAIMSWSLPERVKRLSLPVYRYTETDFAHLQMLVAESGSQQIVGVAAWEAAEQNETPGGQAALLLHGLYVDPAQHRQGIGQQLFQAAEQAAHQHGYTGLLVKAQEQASEFFLAQGMRRLGVDDPERHYAHRFWKPVAGWEKGGLSQT